MTTHSKMASISESSLLSHDLDEALWDSALLGMPWVLRSSDGIGCWQKIKKFNLEDSSRSSKHKVMILDVSIVPRYAQGLTHFYHTIMTIAALKYIPPNSRSSLYVVYRCWLNKTCGLRKNLHPTSFFLLSSFYFYLHPLSWDSPFFPWPVSFLLPLSFLGHIQVKSLSVLTRYYCWYNNEIACG